MSDLPEPIPAATLILMRPAPGGPPELLFMERAGHMAFAAGALVFPGGRIDPGDMDLAARLGGDPDHAAAAICAVRETIEETGIVPALVPVPDEDQAAALRAALQRGEAFSDLLDIHGLALDLAALTLFARWCPTFKETRRFDTLFFVAEAPALAALESADETEAVRTFWASARHILDEANEGRARIIFPTRRNLERLAQFETIEQARADAALYPVQKVVPWIEDRDGTPWLRIPDDIGYPVTAELLATARRT